MTVIIVEGFDTVSDNADLLSSGFSTAGGAVVTGDGVFGGSTYRITSNEDLGKLFSFAKYATASFWFRQNTATLEEGTIFAINFEGVGYTQSDMHIGLHLNLDGGFSFHKKYGNIEGTVSGNYIQPQTWHHIEIQCLMASSGLVKLYVDSLLIATVGGDFFGEDVGSYPMLLSSNYCDNSFDDFVYQDDDSVQPDILGEHRIHALYPDADTAEADWTGSFTDIDETGGPDGDTTFISSSTLNDKSSFGMGDLPESPTTVHLVKVKNTSKKTDVGAVALTSYIDSGGIESAGEEFACSTTYSTKGDLFLLDPSGSVAWTATTVNALKIGVEKTV